MRAIDRVNAVREITNAVISEFDFDDIEIFFSRIGLRRPSGSYSRADLVRAYLTKCADSTLLEIGDQLGLSKSYAHGNGHLGDSKYWLVDHFRIFISHVHTTKQSAANLKSTLQNYGISSFVAHEDISVSDEWREEIIKSLQTMDGLVAILTKDFVESKWTDQEVGFAVCRDVLVIPLSKSTNPYGFIEKFQALNTNGKSVGDVAEQVFRTICANERTKGRMVQSLAKTISTAPNIEIAIFRLDKLANIPNVDLADWESIRENIRANETLSASESLIDKLNSILKTLEIEPITHDEGVPTSSDDEIPF
ncbi:MAG: toll/interleukin-1 receptor domain-containing protein [Hyphomicrobium sp.]